MYRSFVAAAVAALVGTTVAQTADFVNMTFGLITVGSLWPITWSEGNGEAVSLHLVNASWSYAIFEGKPATPGMFDWTVSVPDGFAEGEYSLNLVQVDAGSSISPVFGVSFSTIPPMSSTISNTASVSPTIGTTMSTSMIPNATVTTYPTITVVCPVVWFDEDCSCSKTTTTPVVMPSPTTTEYVFHDAQCGCSKTAAIPDVTALPTCPGADGCSNYTAPMTTPVIPPAGTMAPPAGPSGFMGAASSAKFSASMIAAVVFVGAAFAL